LSGISSTDVTIISLFDILLFLADGTFVSSGLDTEILLVKSSGAGGLIYSSIINGSYSFSETFSATISYFLTFGLIFSKPPNLVS